MNCISIVTDTTYSAEPLALQKITHGFVPEKFVIKYDKNKGLPAKSDSPDGFPLIIYGKKYNISTEIRVYCVTCGYGGTGPHTMLNIVRATGFPIDEDAILSEKFSHLGKIHIEGTVTGMKDLF